jgi:hypothetical protein
VSNWLSQVVDDLADPKTAGVIGALGLILTVVGFVITIVQVRRSKTAAESAAEAVKTVRSQITHFDAAAECVSAIQILEEIERLHRMGPIQMLPERYNAARRALILMRTSKPEAVVAYMTPLQDAIVQLATLKDVSDRLIGQGALGVDTAKSNRITTKIIDNLTQLSGELRNEATKVSNHG